MNELENVDMSSDIEEYKALEKKIEMDFIHGLIKLGAMLKKHRDKWKPQKKYMEYLSKIDRAVSTTNQIIRIYEYSIENMKNLLAVNLTNWYKVNMFLTLPEELREKLGDGINGEDLTASEFRENINDIRVMEDEVEKKMYPIQDEEIEEMIKKAPLDNGDISFMAKQVIQEMRNNEVGDFSDNCVPIASGFLHIEQAIKYLDKEKFNVLTRNEKGFWNKIVKGQIERLTKLLK